jgi:drug/metabolite transporter (DMT)-like permease
LETLTGGRATLVPSAVVAGSAMMWGLWWIPLRALDSNGLSGDWASLAVFGGGTLILAPVALVRRARLWEAGWPAVMVGLLFGVALVAWNHALIEGDVVRVTLLFYLAPIWGTIVGILVLGIRPSALRLVTILVGLTGAAVVLGFEDGWPVPRSLADWMGLAAGVLFALGAALTHRAGHVGDVERTIATFALSTVFAFLFAMVTPASLVPDWAVVSGVLPLVLAATALWYVPVTWTMIWGSARLDPGRVSILLLLEVGVATLSANLLTDEPFGWREAVGGLLIVGAGALEAYDEIRRRTRRVRREPGAA